MSKVSTLEQVVLHSLGNPEDEATAILGSLLTAVDAGYQETRRAYYIAGVQMPSQGQLRDVLQSLRERGYLRVEGCAICGVAEVGDLRNLDIDEWDTYIIATQSGVEAASLSRRLIDSDQGRRLAAEFVRQYIDEQRADLPFDAIVPSWMLTDESFLSQLEVGDENPFWIRYRRDADTVEIEQSNEEFPTSLMAETEPSVVRTETLLGVPIEIREYQITSIWARLTALWNSRDMSFMLVIERNHEVGQYPQWTPASIDDGLREEARSVVRSFIEEQLRN